MNNSSKDSSVAEAKSRQSRQLTDAFAIALLAAELVLEASGALDLVVVDLSVRDEVPEANALLSAVLDEHVVDSHAIDGGDNLSTLVVRLAAVRTVTWRNVEIEVD